MNSSYNSPIDNYKETFDSAFNAPEDFFELGVQIPDDQLSKMLIDSLQADIDYWNKPPFSLRDTDNDNVRYLLEGKGNKGDGLLKVSDDDEYSDNRLFAAMRAILSYATGQLTMPSLTPSKNDDQYVKMARNMQMALYQHSKNEDADIKFRSAGMNLVARKRGFLKLRFDPEAGMYGDVITDVCNPEDVTFDRFSGFLDNPDKIYHRQRDSVEYLCDVKFPKMRDKIFNAARIKQGRFSQLSKMMYYYECWFSYREKSKPREGVAWMLPESHLILDKMPNPNWIYTGDDMKDKKTNVSFAPPKPFVWFNYLNLGRSIIDETSLFDQAKPMQEALNYRLKQFNKAVSLANGRWTYDKSQISEEVATKFVNKGAKTLLGVDYSKGTNPIQVFVPNNVSPSLYESIQDSRMEIDGIMGTPNQFSGKDPSNQNTLGRDQMIKQQAGMLQDDLVRSIANGAKKYYALKLQMFRVYYTDDYYFNIKGGDGKYDLIMLNGDTLDSNVKIGVDTDSNLPLDKPSIRANAMNLAKMGRIDQLTLMEDLGMPNPEIRTERYLRSQIDLYTYMQSVEQGMDNNDAETDIMLIVAGKQPEERDTYDEGYLNYFNHFITLNRFKLLPQKAQRDLVTFLQDVVAKAQRSAQLSESMLNDAGIINRPPIFPLPKRTMNIRLQGNMDPQQTQQIAGTEGQMFTSTKGAEDAQSPASTAQPIQQAGPPPQAP